MNVGFHSTLALALVLMLTWPFRSIAFLIASSPELVFSGPELSGPELVFRPILSRGHAHCAGMAPASPGSVSAGPTPLYACGNRPAASFLHPLVTANASKGPPIKYLGVGSGHYFQAVYCFLRSRDRFELINRARAASKTPQGLLDVETMCEWILSPVLALQPLPVSPRARPASAASK